MRFVAPPRCAVSESLAQHPAFANVLSVCPKLFGPDWPGFDELNAPLIHHRVTNQLIRFVAQTAELLADGRHYEQRIVELGMVATRTENWHDLFNALMWRQFTGLKSAVNWRYSREFPAGVGQERSRPQMAVTHFDEAGVVVVTESDELLAAWDRHDWLGVFGVDGNAFLRRARIHVFGHALLEHCLEPHLLLVGKALVVRGDANDLSLVDWLASQLTAGHGLNDPLELRPLPLSGLPGWYAGQDATFYRTAPCFRPLRAGRVYPAPFCRRD